MAMPQHIQVAQAQPLMQPAMAMPVHGQAMHAQQVRPHARGTAPRPPSKFPRSDLTHPSRVA
jgi:hypothetical protein